MIVITMFAGVAILAAALGIVWLAFFSEREFTSGGRLLSPREAWEKIRRWWR